MCGKVESRSSLKLSEKRDRKTSSLVVLNGLIDFAVHKSSLVNVIVAGDVEKISNLTGETILEGKIH